MLRNELMKKICEVNKELYATLEENNYDLQKPNVLTCSQKLDVLIVKYLEAN